MKGGPGYAELQATSNFSFLRGSSHPEELVTRAAELGHKAIAIADRSTVAGLVRAHMAAREAGIRLLPGARLDLDCGSALLCLPADRLGWERLSKLLTLGKLRGAKNECRLSLTDLPDHAEGQIAIALPPDALRENAAGFEAFAARIAEIFPGRAHVAGHYLYRGDDSARLECLARLAGRIGAPLVATGDVHYHDPRRRPLQDALTCIREGVTLDEAGFRLFANAERHLRPPSEMEHLFATCPGAVAQSVEIANRLAFSLDDLAYEYPIDPTPGETPDEALRREVRSGARTRYPGGVPARVQGLIEQELALVAELGFAPYFLTVHSIVQFARSRSILCQGRGSAANSAICYCLGITAVDPSKFDLLFERFVSRGRKEPPDIDVDFEHERREEVIQHVYCKYGRERAALAATVTTYRARSAFRDMGKVFGLGEDALSALSRATRLRREEPFSPSSLREAGLDPRDRRIALTLRLARELAGFPRHLSQHPGGFVITRRPLHALCPIANAAMEDRTVLEWDKDDLDALGILKIDVLGLGMLSCIRKSFGLIRENFGRKLCLASLPQEDPAVYRMLCKADAVGVFQVESRAQMAMLPRLRPREFYDLVIEVAIVRPGPIQGDMVHPYLRRRNGEEKVSYPSEELRKVLGKTLGVPIFQEQAMRIAIVAAGFTPDEADGLRRAMAAWRRHGSLEKFRGRFIDGMTARGYQPDFAERCFRQIEGFSDYGFPESHAASFAHLVYASAWLKRHYPAAFACALLNSQPMGFYRPAQIIRDAQEHGVEVRPADINHSAWDSTLEPAEDGSMALRIGFREIRGMAKKDATRIAGARGNGYSSLAVLQRRAALKRPALERLAEADAFASLRLARREALWAVALLPPKPADGLAAELDEMAGEAEEPARLPFPEPGEEIAADYASTGFSLRCHPLALLRESPETAGQFADTTPAADLARLRNGAPVRVAGLVIVRQRPGTARGVMFLTLEDETGSANAIVWPDVLAAHRSAAVGSRLLAIRGQLQRQGAVIHVIARRLEDRSHLLDDLSAPGSRPGIRALAREFR